MGQESSVLSSGSANASEGQSPYAAQKDFVATEPALAPSDLEEAQTKSSASSLTSVAIKKASLIRRQTLSATLGMRRTLQKASGAAAFAFARESATEKNLRQTLRDRMSVPVHPPDDVHDLCATISHEINFHEDPLTFEACVFQAYSKNSVKAAVLINQGVLHSRLAVVVRNKTAVVVWRGSKTPVEWVTDTGFSPSFCHLWMDLAAEIQVHGAIMAVIEHDFYAHRNRLMELIREHEVTALVFSGHSLGGALAQVAHLAFLGQMHIGKVEKLELSTVAFAAPMVFYHSGALMSEATCHVLEQIFEQSINWVFHTDVIARLPGHPEFWLPASKDLVANLAKRTVAETGNRIGRAVTWKLLFGDGRLDLLFEAFVKHTKDTTEAFKGYRHTSKLYVLFPYNANDGPSGAFEVEEMDHFSFLQLGYTQQGDGQEIQVVESEFLAEFHTVLPRNMARTHGYFRLKHLDTDEYLAVGAGGEVGMTAPLDCDADDWYFRRVRVPWWVRPPDGSFRLEGKASGKWLSVRSDGCVETSDDPECDEQYWRMHAGSDHSFRLESVALGHFLTVCECNGVDQVCVYGQTGHESHEWRIRRRRLPSSRASCSGAHAGADAITP